MSPPRRPKGEKPRITIRYLQRQIANMEQVIYSLRRDNEDKDKVIAGDDVQLSEAQDENRRLQEHIYRCNTGMIADAQRLAAQSSRLQFLEGYYAAKQEALTGNTHRGAGAADTPTFPHGGPIAEDQGAEIAALWPNQKASGEIQLQPARDRAYPDRRSMAEVEIGSAADASPVQRERHRR